MDRTKFWMVLGGGQPTHHHPSLESAKTEAERLARLHHGQEFTVLEAVATVVRTDVTWVRRGDESEQDVPF